MSCDLIRRVMFQDRTKMEIRHTPVLEMFRWETIPEVKLYVAVSVFLPVLPAKVLAAHDDQTSTFPVL